MFLIIAESVQVRLDHLRYVPDYKCRKCTGEIRPLEGLPAESVGDMISVVGGIGESIVARIRYGWNKFRWLLPLLPRCFHCAQKVKCSIHVRNVVLYGSETCVLKEEDLIWWWYGGCVMWHWSLLTS